MNIWAIHMNPTLWKDPETFNPDRWLDDGHKHMIHPYQFLPFSAGRRVCVGESLAKVELHLYVAMLLQKLEFRPAPGQEQSFKVDMHAGSVHIIADPFEIIAVPRA